ncbi:HAL/PAL/TAL family ammonia-lyase [Sinosporangium siamense]|uniref:Histidine ammonia-lyase n=1 Tax=Sinosporangium siamense TaxID=1367973 RepID=A0A919RBP5_9ACTN|nr:aromatic amino acid ammonia-lyase [Sinosporangium siamense]GII90697.1 histidine ammonia-lyase [Sinosporangium siamense]
MTAFVERQPLRRLAEIVRSSGWQATLDPCDFEAAARMEASASVLAKKLAAQDAVYGVTRGFGPLVAYDAADSAAEQGAGLIAHLASGQGRPLPPDEARLIFWLRLSSMLKGYSAVSPTFWQALADRWNAGFTPAIPQHGTVSASGDLQPLAHAALAIAGTGEAWARGDDGEWTVRPAAQVLSSMGLAPIEWSAREALAFVNGTSVSLAKTIVNHQSVMRLVRAVGVLTARIAELLGSNSEAYHEGIGRARGQQGQLTVAAWIRAGLPEHMERDPRRPLQEPYSLRCAPQVLGAVLDQLLAAEEILVREANGCTDNPICYEGELLHGGNFHAMPVGLCSDQVGLCLQQVAYLAERQLALLCDPSSNSGLPPMLTPRPGAGSGLAGVQLSATSFVSRIRQLVYPASLTALPTNGGNQDHVPMALNGANSVAEALELAWLVVGSLGVAVSQWAALSKATPADDSVWARLAELSPPLERDRPLAAEVRACRDLISQHAAELLGADEDWN